MVTTPNAHCYPEENPIGYRYSYISNKTWFEHEYPWSTLVTPMNIKTLKSHSIIPWMSIDCLLRYSEILFQLPTKP